MGTPTCPVGDGFPQGFEYRWADGDKVKAPIRCSGPKYVDYVLSWVEDLLNNEATFPVSVGDVCFTFFYFEPNYLKGKSVSMCYNCRTLTPRLVFFSRPAVGFPRNFDTIVKQIYTRLFRIFAIVYSNHLPVLEELGAVAHLNTSFKHFVFFCWEFDLIKKNEEEPLQDLVDEIRRRHQS